MSNEEPLYTAKGVRELDRLSIEQFGIPGFTLMQRAGQAAFNQLIQQWPDVSRLLIFCGGGNNGGDAYIVAALAREAGLECQVLTLSEPGQLKGSAAEAFIRAQRAGMKPVTFDSGLPLPEPTTRTVVIDGLLGTGLKNAVRSPYREAIEWINESGLPVLALDIPSGLNSDTGETMTIAVKATLTVSFIALKVGQTLAEGPSHCGKLKLEKLGVPAEVYTLVEPV